MQTKHDYENQQIKIYWWNFGKKILDFQGSYKDYLKQKGIHVRIIKKNEYQGFRFTMPSPYKVTLDIYDYNYSHCCDEIIKVFLTLMGDRSKLITPNRDFNINW